jgi:hypothetical protein
MTPRRKMWEEHAELKTRALFILSLLHTPASHVVKGFFTC